MSWDAGFMGGEIPIPPPSDDMTLWQYLGMLVVAGAVTYFRQALEVLGKEIDDEETGWKGVVRDVAKLLAGYRKNKEYKGDTEQRPAYLGKPKEPEEEPPK